MCILLNVKKHEKTFALNVDIFKPCKFHEKPVDNGSRNKYTVKACQKRCVYYTIKKEVKQNANI